MMFLDLKYVFLIMLPAIILSLWTQGRVQAAFKKYSRIRSSSGLTGAEAAARMLRDAGLSSVGIERIDGSLTDHYDPRSKVLRLSSDVYNSNSLSAVGVACHEAGHAVQDARHYAPLALRNAIVPTANIGSRLGLYLIVFGVFLRLLPLAWFGVALFGAVVVFQIVNLPVEFNASARAKKMLPALGIINGREESIAIDKVLNAAALTYVAATAIAIMQLLYFISRLSGRNN